MTDSAGLTGNAAAGDGDNDVNLAQHVGGDQGLTNDQLQGLQTEVIVDVAESQLKNGVIDATDLLRKISDETAAALARSTHEIELLQATYRLKTTLNQ